MDILDFPAAEICHLIHASSLKIHISSVHEEEKPFKCGICQASFSAKGDMNRHISSVHEKKKPFNCGVCQASFSTKGDMNRHISSVHGL